MPAPNIAIIGATGLVGNEILKLADSLTSINLITTFTRNSLKYQPSGKVTSIVESTENWPEAISKLDHTDAFISAFGTTKAAAGGADNFIKIDYGINLEAAKAAKAKGIETFVLVSTIGASATSRFFYLKTKGQLEDDIIALKFPRTIIIRPGVLLGDRTESKGPFNDVIMSIGSKVHNTFLASTLFHPVYAQDIAKVVTQSVAEPVSTMGPEINIIDAEQINKLAKAIK